MNNIIILKQNNILLSTIGCGYRLVFSSLQLFIRSEQHSAYTQAYIHLRNAKVSLKPSPLHTRYQTGQYDLLQYDLRHQSNTMQFSFVAIPIIFNPIQYTFFIIPTMFLHYLLTHMFLPPRYIKLLNSSLLLIFFNIW